MQIRIIFIINSNCPEFYSEFLDSTQRTELFAQNFSRESLLEPDLRKKKPYSFFKHEFSIFISFLR